MQHVVSEIIGSQAKTMIGINALLVVVMVG